jgi:hypothetical protein
MPFASPSVRLAHKYDGCRVNRKSLLHIAQRFFVHCYQLVYLAAIAANVILVTIDKGLHLGLLPIYLIALMVFALNAVAWRAWTRGETWAPGVEKVLSAGRLLMIVLGATVFLAALVAQNSPVGWILWWKIMFPLMNQGFGWYWSACAILLVLESLYFRALSRAYRGAASVALSEALS